MDQEHFSHQSLYITMLCALYIARTSIAFGITDPPPFECHADICNLQQTGQFCSKEYRYCRSCSEVLDDCFTPAMPLNCSKTCINHEVEERLAAERDTTCKPLPDIYNGAWSNESQVFELDQTITAICKTGFTLSGCKSWTCTRTGWRGFENENVMPSCYQTPDNKWLVGFICISGVLVFVIVACAGFTFWKRTRDHKMLKPTAPNYDEESAGLLKNQDQDNQGSTDCVDDSKKETESSKPPPVERTVSLDEKRKARESKTDDWFVRVENELPKGRSDATLNTRGVKVNVTINTSSSSTIGNVSAITNASPESKTSKDASTQPADKSENGELMKGSQQADAKLSQEESATSDQRQPLDAHPSPRPEIDESGSSSTYPATLSQRSSSIASEACRGPPNDSNKRNPRGFPENELNGQDAIGHDQGKIAVGRDNIPLEDINRVSVAGERKWDVGEKGRAEQGATGRDAGKLAVGRDHVPLREVGGTNSPRDHPREFLDNVKQEVTEQGVGKVALGSKNIPFGDIDGTPRAVHDRIQVAKFAGIPQSDVTERDARKMAVGNGRGNIGLEDANGTYRAATGHTPAIPALDSVFIEQISRL